MFRKTIKTLMGFPQQEVKSKQPEPKETRPMSSKVDDNLKALREIFDLCSDVVVREFILRGDKPVKAFIIYIRELCGNVVINDYIVKPLMMESEQLKEAVRLSGRAGAESLFQNLLTYSNTWMSSDIVEITDYILKGDLALIIDGSATAIIADVVGGQQRAVEEPDSEPVVRGPRDGFVESIDTNLSLIRRRLKTSRLKIEFSYFGELTKNKVAVCYIKGITNDKTVEEIKARIKRIKGGAGNPSSSYVEEMIMDEALSIFPLLDYTERPDKSVAALLEGQVVILVDNTPMNLIAPATYITFLQASEDYYNEPIFGTFVRLIRFVAINLALLLPAVAVAILSFHQEMLPTQLLSTVQRARQGLPFPIFVEVLIMELTFELLREAGLRLPKTIGQAVSTVGGLVIGQAAVNAGFVSPLPVIVVALTAIASFTFPNYAAGTSIRILRFGLLALAAFMGAVGIMFGLIIILIHLCGLRSFGVPYLSPIAPLSPRDLKDTFVRVPWWAMITRPRFGGSKEPIRVDPDSGPIKPGEGGDES